MANAQTVIHFSPKVYRHFAIATAVITGCLALFANGHNRKVVQDRIDQQAQRMEVKANDRKLAASGKGGNSASNFKDNRTVKGTFGEDAGTPSGSSAPGGASGSSPYGRAVYGGAQQVPGSRMILVDQVPPQLAAQMPRTLPPGMSPQEYLALKASEKMKGQKLASSRQPGISGAPGMADPGAYLAASAAQSVPRAK